MDESPPNRRRRLPLGVWQILAIGLVAALALVALYYGISVAHESAFNDERAFRVLGDVSTQFRSLETSRAAILRYMPDRIKNTMPSCVAEGNAEFRQGTDAQTRTDFKSYLSRLDLVEARLCRSSPPGVAAAKASAGAAASSGDSSSDTAIDTSGDSAIVASLCKFAERNEVIFQVSGDRMITVWCTATGDYTLNEPFYRAAKHFISQDFFSETLLVLSDGTVLGEFPGHDTASTYSRVSLQFSVADTVNILNAQALIRMPARSSGDVQSTGTSDVAPAPRSLSDSSRQPIAFNHDVGRQNYRVYALPFAGTGNFIPDRMSSTLERKPDQSAVGAKAPETAGAAGEIVRNEAAPNQDHAFYVVGLRRLDLPNTIIHALWPGGLWLLTLLIPLSILAWPLLKLEFGHSMDSISKRRAIACILGAVLIPVLLIVAAASMWNYLELKTWASLNSATYAGKIDRTIRQQLVDGAEILNSYASVYDGIGPCDSPEPASAASSGRQNRWTSVFASCQTNSPAAPSNQPPLLSFDNKRKPIYAVLKNCNEENIQKQICSTVQVYASPLQEPEFNWSPFRSVLALDATGKRNGPVLTSFKPVELKQNLNLSSREYFQALKAGEAWDVKDAAGHQVDVVAERLFNSTDASKTLQLAVPRCRADGVSGASPFCGIISGSMRVHNFLIAEPPPLLRFAVIDTDNGTVVFHSNDSRSLAENFFLESELAPLLYAAIGAKQPMSYPGKYIGDPHNFYYKPIVGTPWGVVVFFPAKELGDLSFRAGSAAISAYLSVALTLLLIGIFARWLWCNFLAPKSPHVSLFERLWPKLPLAPRYFVFSRWYPSIWALAALVIATIAGFAGYIGAAVAFAILVIFALAASFRRPWKSGASTDSVTPIRREQAFVETHVCLLFVVSILPAYLFFISFSHLQLQGLLRDELAQTARQMERRFDLIRTDLQHWAPTGEDWQPSKYPTLWTLVSSPNLGISGSTDKGVDTVDPNAPPMDLSLSVFAKLIWKSVADSEEQRRRIELLDHTESDESICRLSPKEDVEQCTVKLFDRAKGTIWMKLPPTLKLFSDKFDWYWPTFCAVAFAFAGVWIGTRFVCRALTRGLIGLNASYMSRPALTHGHGASSGDAAESYTLERFRATWKSLSRPEQLLLYQLTLNHFVNPRNEGTVELLLKRDLIRIDPYPRLRSAEIGRFIRCVETNAHFEELRSTATRGVWKTIGLPLFIVLMILIAWLSWAAGGTMKALSAILLATIAFLGQISQLVSIARSGFSGTPKGDP
jgi:hypothetical protein